MFDENLIIFFCFYCFCFLLFYVGVLDVFVIINLFCVEFIIYLYVFSRLNKFKSEFKKVVFFLNVIFNIIYYEFEKILGNFIWKKI